MDPPPEYYRGLVEVGQYEHFDLTSFNEDEVQKWYRINDAELFWSQYIDWISSSKEGEFSEPIRGAVQFAFWFHAKSRHQKMPDSERFAARVVEVLQEVIEENVELGEDREQLCVVVLEQGDAAIDEMVLRFQTPFLVLNDSERKKIFEAFMIRIGENHVLRKHLPELEESDEQFIPYYDTIPLLLSHGTTDQNPMDFYNCYHSHEGSLVADINMNQVMVFGDNYPHPELIKTLLAEDEHELPLEQLLILFLSMEFKPPKSNLKKATNDVVDHIYTPREFIDLFLPMIPKFVYKDEVTALDVGQVIFSVFEHESQGRQRWLDALRYAHAENPLPYLEPDEDISTYVESRYENFTGTVLTYKSLAHYARLYNHIEYDQWHNGWIEAALEEAVRVPELLMTSKSVKLPHTKVADAIYRYYWLDHVCINTRKKSWFHHNGTRWVMDDNGNGIYLSIPRDFCGSVLKVINRLTEEMAAKNKDKQIREEIGVKLARYVSMVTQLQNTAFLNNIMTQVTVRFYDSDFLNRLDTTVNLLAAKNRVLDIQGANIFVRVGKPEDYISKSLPINLRTDLHWKHPKVVKLLRWLKQVFFDEELNEYFLCYASSGLYGRNLERFFTNLLGKGGNGKSLVVQLFELTMGSYVIKLPVSALTGKRVGQGNVSPEFARIEGARWIFIDEMGETDKITGPMFKLISSNGDSMFARALHSNGKDVKMNAHPSIICNDPPEFPNADGAVVDRYLQIPCLSRWDNKAPTDEAEQERLHHYPKNEDFPEEIKELTEAFLWVMVEYWPKYKAGALRKIPKIVQEYTQRFWDSRDSYLLFTKHAIEFNKSKKGKASKNYKASVDEVYDHFVRWFGRFYGKTNKPPECPVFLNRISERWGAPVNGYWLGVELKEFKTASTGRTSNTHSSQSNRAENQADPARKTTPGLRRPTNPSRATPRQA